MIKYVNNLGITCVEPEEGYLLRKNGQVYKKVYLGKNDKAEYYEEVVDTNYVPSIDSTDNSTQKEPEKEMFYILTSPGGKKFKLTISDDGILNAKEI